MGNASTQAHAFYREVAASRRVWTVRDAAGYPAPETSQGVRAQPFWSSRERAERVIKNVPAYRSFSIEETSWEEFRDRWLPDLRRDGMLVGVNWAGRTATGLDLDPDWVQHGVEALIEQAGGPPATPLELVEGEKGGTFYRLARLFGRK